MRLNIEQTIRYLKFDESISLFAETFQFQFGAQKTDEIIKKIHNSNTVNKYLTKICSESINPNSYDLYNIINKTRFFIFSKSEYKCFAALIVLSIWDSKVNNKFNREISFQDEQNIVIELIRDLEKLSPLYSDSFLHRFYKVIEEVDQQQRMKAEGFLKS